MSATRVALAGSTGSIGTQALDVVTAEAARFELTALGATGRNPEVLIEQARIHRPKVVAVADEAAAKVVADALPECEVRGGADAMASLATEADVVVNGVVGFAGLPVTLATLEAGCSAPIAANAFIEDELLFLTATVYSADGARKLTSSHAATPESRSADDLAEAAGDVAERVVAELLGNGAADLATNEEPR